MLLEYQNLSDEELDGKMEEVMKKMHMASRMGQDSVVEQLQKHFEIMQLEMNERIEKIKFRDINSRTPQSFIVGEDDDTDAPTSNRD
jgi:phosphoenolpyruvate-protein kinase (PTS system EI component)